MKASFIIPAYNDEDHIGECLEKATSLTGNDYEFIVIDDGSSDSTGTICDQFAKKDQRVTVIHQENQGVSIARNRGIESAKGEWLVFVDGDDYIYPEAFADRIIPAAEPDCDIIYFEYDTELQGRIIHPDNVLETPVVFETPEKIRSMYCALWNRHYSETWNIISCGIAPASPWAKMYRTSFVRENGLRFMRGIIRAQDQLFNAGAFQFVKKIKILPYKGYVYRERGGRAYNYNKKLLENDKLLLAEHRELLKDNNDEQIALCYNCWLCAHVVHMLRLEFCNPGNPKKYKERKREFFEYISAEPIRSALRNVDMDELGRSRGIIIRLAVSKRFFILDRYYNNTKNAASFASIRNRLDSRRH